MSLVKKYCLSSFKYKNISACCYLFSENRLNYAQYYTCLSSSQRNVQPGVFKCKRSVENSRRSMSVVQYVREKNFYLGTKIKDFSQGVLTYMPFFGVKYKRLGYLWFGTLDQVDTEVFYEKLKLRDTFYSRFQIIELHVWMLLCHLPKVTRIDRFVRLGVIEAMWKDSQERAKMVAEINVNSKKNFRALYGEFLFCQIFYDYCFNKSDAALCSAVWCNFFNRENVDPRLLEALVSYIRYQMNHLNKLNLADYNVEIEKLEIWAPVRPYLEAHFKKS